ncbi:uncharacterized protein LOC135824414 [Sycon ciliatum]|uniref:uncharacterized protein LOC135824414 n=1 Tax=Sycon ciliatum TaxID=27933 RepID=UPI0031F63294
MVDPGVKGGFGFWWLTGDRSEKSRVSETIRGQTRTCLPRQNDQMEPKPMASDISCRYDVLNCSVPVIQNGMSNASLVQYGATVLFTCEHTYFLWGNSSATCNGDGTLSSVPICYRLTGERVCGTTMTITRTTDRRLSYTSGQALCSRHNGTILSETSFRDGCANGLTDAIRVAWRGLPDKNITALTTFGIRVDLSRHFLVVCEFPCLPRQSDQMESKPTASDISCRYDELIGNRICRASGSITRISIPGLKLNYTSAQALCSRHNGRILSEASFHALCSVGLTNIHAIAWRGLPKGNVARNSNGQESGLAQFLRVVCEIPCLPRQNDQMESKPMASDISCRYDELIGNRICRASGSITRISAPGLKLNYTSAQALCSRHNGTILSKASFQALCSVRLTDFNNVAWVGLPKGNVALNSNSQEASLAQLFHVVCEIPCLPRQNDQMEPKPMASDISCRYDELIGNRICRASGSITRISTPGLILNYTSAQALCSKYNGTILSEASFHALCSVGLTNLYNVAWVGLPKGNVALNTNTREASLAQLLHVVCEIPVNCAVPSVGNGTADSTMIRWGSNVSFSCNEGFLLVGDVTSTCTVHGNLTSLPLCEAINCAVPSVGNGTADSTMIRRGSNVSFSCNEGFLLKGDTTSTCTVHGNLTSLPLCEAVSGNQKEGKVATEGLIVGVTFGLVILLGIIAFAVYPEKSKKTAVTLVSRVKLRQKQIYKPTLTYSVSPACEDSALGLGLLRRSEVIQGFAGWLDMSVLVTSEERRSSARAESG